MLLSRRNLFLAPLLQAAPRTKITRIETVYWKSRDAAPFWPHWTWIRLHTDTGLVGLGETYPRGPAESALLHSDIARTLLGKSPFDIERLWHDFYTTFDFQIAGGTELRCLSAVDLALWDLLGKSLNAPVWKLLGGQSNPRVRVYNTCFPYKYDFAKEPERIMRELIDRHNIRAIKVWPFDPVARRNGGQFVTRKDIDEGLAPIRKLRDAFAEDIEILVEFHSFWNLSSAIRIARALEPLKPMWLEDMLLPGNFAQYRQLAEATSLPLTIGERMAGKLQFQSLLDQRAAKFIMFDVCWCGGLTEARKITALADAHQLPFAAHTAGGPLLFYASTHLSTAMPNCWIQESVQRFYESDWPKMLVDPLVPKDGHITAPDRPGFGLELQPGIWDHPAAVRQVSSA